MSVVAATKMWSKTGGAVSSEQANPFDVQYSFTDGWQVLLDAPNDNAHQVMQEAVAAGVPNIGDQYPDNINAYVKKLTPQRVSPILYLVTVAYEGVSNDNAVVDVAWSSITSTENIDRDWNGRAIVTANNEQVQGLSMDITDQVVVIKRKFLTINTYALDAYLLATNSDVFLGRPAGTGKLVAYEATNQFKYGAAQELWSVTARIQFRVPYNGTTPAQAWYKRWRHEGLLVRDGATIRRALDDQGQELTKPVLLQANGEQETNPDNALFIHTQVYGSLPYSALGLV